MAADDDATGDAIGGCWLRSSTVSVIGFHAFYIVIAVISRISVIMDKV